MAQSAGASSSGFPASDAPIDTSRLPTDLPGLQHAVALLQIVNRLASKGYLSKQQKATVTDRVMRQDQAMMRVVEAAKEDDGRGLQAYLEQVYPSIPFAVVRHNTTSPRVGLTGLRHAARLTPAFAQLSVDTSGMAGHPGSGPMLQIPPPMALDTRAPPQDVEALLAEGHGGGQHNMGPSSTKASAACAARRRSKRTRTPSFRQYEAATAPFGAKSRTGPSPNSAAMRARAAAAGVVVPSGGVSGAVPDAHTRTGYSRGATAGRRTPNATAAAARRGGPPPQAAAASAGPRAGGGGGASGTNNSNAGAGASNNGRRGRGRRGRGRNAAADRTQPRKWTTQEDAMLRQAVERFGERNWKSIASQVPGRNHVQCLQRWKKVLRPGLVKGHWTSDEDEMLKALVAEGPSSWSHVAGRIEGRTAKQCRERWCNHLDPRIKKGNWTPLEDQALVEAHAYLGKKWAQISKFLPGRTENAVKIRWKSLIRRANQRGPEGVRARLLLQSTETAVKEYRAALNEEIVNPYGQRVRRGAQQAAALAQAVASMPIRMGLPYGYGAAGNIPVAPPTSADRFSPFPVRVDETSAAAYQPLTAVAEVPLPPTSAIVLLARQSFASAFAGGGGGSAAPPAHMGVAPPAAPGSGRGRRRSGGGAAMGASAGFVPPSVDTSARTAAPHSAGYSHGGLPNGVMASAATASVTTDAFDADVLLRGTGTGRLPSPFNLSNALGAGGQRRGSVGGLPVATHADPATAARYASWGWIEKALASPGAADRSSLQQAAAAQAVTSAAAAQATLGIPGGTPGGHAEEGVDFDNLDALFGGHVDVTSPAMQAFLAQGDTKRAAMMQAGHVPQALQPLPSLPHSSVPMAVGVSSGAAAVVAPPSGRGGGGGGGGGDVGDMETTTMDDATNTTGVGGRTPMEDDGTDGGEDPDDAGGHGRGGGGGGGGGGAPPLATVGGGGAGGGGNGGVGASVMSSGQGMDGAVAATSTVDPWSGGDAFLQFARSPGGGLAFSTGLTPHAGATGGLTTMMLDTPMAAAMSSGLHTGLTPQSSSSILGRYVRGTGFTPRSGYTPGGLMLGEPSMTPANAGHL